MIRRVISGHYRPVHLYRMGRCWIRNKVLARTSISSIELINTLRCNARCGFCSNHKLTPGEQTMKRELGMRVLAEAYRLKIPMVIFLGGEGLLDENIFDYFDRCHRYGIIPQYASNGTLLTAEMIGRLAQHRVNDVCITIHDTDPAQHDAIVGINGAFDRILTAIRLMKSRGFTVSVKAIYSKSSIASGAFDRIIAFCRREGVVPSANPHMPVGRGVERTTCLGSIEIEDYYRRCRIQGIGDHVYNGWHPGCIAGKTYFGILPGGEILPCYFLPVCVGNIAEMPLDRAIKVCADIPLFAKRHMRCPVATSMRLYDEVIAPLYTDCYRSLPVDLLQDNALREKLTSLQV